MKSNRTTSLLLLQALMYLDDPFPVLMYLQFQLMNANF